MRKQRKQLLARLNPTDWILSGLHSLVQWFDRPVSSTTEESPAKDSMSRAAVKRADAQAYLFLIVISFALSVTITRYFLELTGYPQLGNEELHIAHVLWGGLFLCVACILMLTLANRWVYAVGALVTGTGLGLFIDEVGKFITQSNDYFYPFAAPLIYLLFVMTLRLYIRVRRPANPSPRAVLYRVLERLTELLDSDLEEEERASMAGDLERVLDEGNDRNLGLLASKLTELLNSPELVVVPTRLTRSRRLARWWDHLHARPQARDQFTALLAAASLGLAVRPILRLGILAQGLLAPGSVDPVLASFQVSSPFAPVVPVGMLSTLVAFEGGLGLLFVVACFLFLFRRESKGASIFRGGLWFYVGILNIPLFYVNQFSALGVTILQFLVLWSLTQFRIRHLAAPPAAIASPG